MENKMSNIHLSKGMRTITYTYYYSWDSIINNTEIYFNGNH